MFGTCLSKSWRDIIIEKENLVERMSRFDEDFDILSTEKLPICCHPVLSYCAGSSMADRWHLYSTEAKERSTGSLFTFRVLRCSATITGEWEQLDRLHDLMMREAQMMSRLSQDPEDYPLLKAAWLEQRILSEHLNEDPMTFSVKHVLRYMGQAAPFLGMLPNFVERGDSDDSSCSDVEDDKCMGPTIAEPKVFIHEGARVFRQCNNTKLLEISAFMQLHNHSSLENWIKDTTRPPFNKRKAHQAMIRVFYQIVEQISTIHSEGLVHLHICHHNVFVTRCHQRAELGGLAHLSQPGQRKTVEHYCDCHVYCSPELREGLLCDSHSDMFSLGILLLYEVCHASGFLNSKLISGILEEASHGFHCPPTLQQEFPLEISLINGMLQESSFERLECFEVLEKLNNISDRMELYDEL